MRYKSFIYVSFCILLLSSCKRSTSSQIEYEKSFEEISQMATTGNKDFCIVLSNPDCPPCDVLHEVLFEGIGRSVGDKAIFNVVDVSLPQNKWYGQLIASKATPATLLFSPQSELKAIIHGSSPDSLQCIKSAANGKLDCARHLYLSAFPESTKHEDLIRSLNLLLRARTKLEKQEDATAELEECMQTLYYPYLLWLQIQNEQNKGNEASAVSLARQMLTFQQSMYASLYGDLYLKARYVINPDFDIKDAPFLELESDRIDFGECKVGEKVSFSIQLKNTGRDTLRIYDASVSCTCMELLSTREYTLASGAESSMQVVFTPDHTGRVEREIIVTTNEVDPSRRITITANVIE